MCHHPRCEPGLQQCAQSSSPRAAMAHSGRAPGACQGSSMRAVVGDAAAPAGKGGTGSAAAARPSLNIVGAASAAPLQLSIAASPLSAAGALHRRLVGGRP
jgi:hypothetical protein